MKPQIVFLLLPVCVKSSVVFEKFEYIFAANGMDLQIFKFQWKTKGFLLSLFGTIKFQVLLYFEPEGAYDDESNQSMMAHGRTYFKFYATTNGSYLIEYFGFKWSLFTNEKWD